MTEDSQSGELAHVREGRVGQGVDPIVAQVSEREIKTDCEVTASVRTTTPRAPSGQNLHQLQVFEAGQFLRHNAELVSVQIPEPRHKGSIMRKSHEETDRRQDQVYTEIYSSDVVILPPLSDRQHKMLPGGGVEGGGGGILDQRFPSQVHLSTAAGAFSAYCC